ncbi:MAG TPA: M20/M25/M40 family metallo-hydrolase [Steroidobacteraceae bacterium]|nr:M20/M25/M40 family metallo-hydrolase [Steroidobacteraceae bacterium]
MTKIPVRQICAFAAGLALVAAAGAATGTPPGPIDAKSREILAKVISIPTQLGKAKVPEMAEYLAGEFRAAGFPPSDVTITPFKLPDNDTATLVVRYRGDGTGGKPIVLLAHMDVVTAERADWERDPYTLVEENGFFFGRGTADNKAGVTHLTALFLRLKAEKYVPKRDLIIYFSGDEETSQATTQLMAKQHRELIDAEFALNSDSGGGNLDDETGKPTIYAVQAAEKTYADFTLTARNPGGHSSAPRADNAIYDLSSALLKVGAFRFPVMWNDITIASFRESGKTTPGALGEAMKKFAENPRDEAAAKVLADNPGTIGQTRTTCVATMLNGGHAENALPQRATANVNCRIFPGVKIEEVRGTLAKVVGEGVEVTVKSDPLSSDPSPLRKDVLNAVTRAVHKFYPGTPVVPYQGSGATDGLVFRSIGIPTYATDAIFMRDKDSFSHGLNERIPVKSFYEGNELWYLIVKELAGTGKAARK